MAEWKRDFVIGDLFQTAWINGVEMVVMHSAIRDCWYWGPFGSTGTDGRVASTADEARTKCEEFAATQEAF